MENELKDVYVIINQSYGEVYSVATGDKLDSEVRGALKECNLDQSEIEEMITDGDYGDYITVEHAVLVE